MKPWKFFIVCLVIAGCTNVKEGVVKDVTPNNFEQMMKATPEIIVLDVRTPQEVAGGFITGAKNIDFRSPDFKAAIDALDKSQTYVVYCAGGGRSSKAREMMEASGFRQVINLEGGFNAWKDAGLPIANSK